MQSNRQTNTSLVDRTRKVEHLLTMATHVIKKILCSWLSVKPYTDVLFWKFCSRLIRDQTMPLLPRMAACFSSEPLSTRLSRFCLFHRQHCPIPVLVPISDSISFWPGNSNMNLSRVPHLDLRWIKAVDPTLV
jgi:hypothetical protein